MLTEKFHFINQLHDHLKKVRDIQVLHWALYEELNVNPEREYCKAFVTRATRIADMESVLKSMGERLKENEKES